MIRAFILFMATAVPALADGDNGYREALQTAEREAQAEYDRLAPVNVGLPSDEDTGSDTIDFYSAGKRIENAAAEIVAIYDDTANMCIWGYEVDTFPSLPRTAALAVKAKADALNWPAQATAQWSTTVEGCTSRTSLATSLGDLLHIERLAVGPHIVYFGLASVVAAS